jgi:hypothetical protein
MEGGIFSGAGDGGGGSFHLEDNPPGVLLSLGDGQSAR